MRKSGQIEKNNWDEGRNSTRRGKERVDRGKRECWLGEEKVLTEGRENAGRGKKRCNRGKRECWLREEKVLTEGRENAG